MATRAGGGEPPVVGRSSSGGHWLGGLGAAMCSGGGHGGDGGSETDRGVPFVWAYSMRGRWGAWAIMDWGSIGGI
jgi:hypothetical protein